MADQPDPADAERPDTERLAAYDLDGDDAGSPHDGRFWTRRAIITASIIAALVIAGITTAVLWPSGDTVSATATSAPPSSSRLATTSPPAASGSSTPTPDATLPGGVPVPPAPRDPVGVDAQPTIVPGLTASLVKIEAVDGEAKGPGQTAGPAIRVTVRIANSTGDEASLDTAVITAYYGSDLTPANELDAPGGSPLPSSVPAGGSSTGVYIFTIPTDQRDDVTIMLDYSVDVAPLVFQGRVPA